MDMKKILLGMYFFIMWLMMFSTAFAWHNHHAHATVASAAPPPVVGGLQLGAYNLKVGTIQAYFDGWTDTPSCAPAGQQTLIFWENYGVSLDSIIGGTEDAVIKKFTSGVCPNTVIAPFAEMDGNWDSWDGTVGSNTPAKITAAWQHIHTIIGSKVKYAWVVNDSDVPDESGNRPSDYWPGSAYVDIIGVDGFDWGGMTFLQSIAPNYDVVKSYGKPVWITSFGTESGNTSAWLTDAIAQAEEQGIAALVYFDENTDGNFKLDAGGISAYHL